MDHFANQVDGLRNQMLEAHKLELRKLAGLDQALLADDVALRDELRGIRQRHETRRGDIRAELESFASSLGMLPAPRQVRAVPAPAELPTVDQALAQLERGPQIATIPGMNAGVPNVTAAAPHVPAPDPRFAAAAYDDPMPRIVTNRARG
ncbi:MAG: hypothetical protein B7Y80_01650 [Hyphomicrobium sp. 32-62-53]|nr:MAG: hypothetical protein B7Z29_02000 [Hyphomicrobium sp. 12-62-95]OYY01459.1 MAG: hypothetical protein B7Y80_01650 [Hyphomicrobium sp. 32-62-53]